MKPYYQDKWVTIYHGDCREILPQLDVKVDLVLTDPPYGLGFAYTQFNDNQDELHRLITDIMPKLRQIADRILLTCGHTNIWHYPPADWVLAWIFGTTNQRNSWGFTSWQPILAYGKDAYLANCAGARMDIIQDSRVPQGYDVKNHPCPKSESFISKLIIRGSFREGETILDPFLGSGTTCFCAKKLNRYSIGIEIEEKYCEIAARRCSQEVMEFNCLPNRTQQS